MATPNCNTNYFEKKIPPTTRNYRTHVEIVWKVARRKFTFTFPDFIKFSAVAQKAHPRRIGN